MATLTPKQAELFLGKNFAVVATLKPDGGPQTSIVWIDWDGEHVVFTTTRPRPVRAKLVTRLAAAGLARIEAVSFVRDELVPQMADAEEVVAAADRGAAELSGLVLNERGHERFAATSLDRLNCTLAATEEF